jgi:hypothetical protein
VRREYRSPGVSTGFVGSDALKPGKESNGRDGKQSERREVSRQFVLPAAFLCAGYGYCTGTAALLVHGLLSLSLQHRASWARKVDAASILRLKKVPEMETMWFPLVDFRCLRGCRAMINRFSNFRYISLKNG